MGRQLDIAQRCRNAGLRVIEVAGWQTRGDASFNPRGSVNHHTAGSPNGTAPSLGGVINGFAGSAPGPLANALQSREPDGNDIFYIVAAGRANHAGRGGWRGLSGNSSVFGLEIEHTGVVPLPEHRQKLAARWHAAMASGRYSSEMVCQHKEWAPGRKIDAATHVDGDQFRRWVLEAFAPLPPPQPEPEPDFGDAVLLFAIDDGTYRVLNADNEVRFLSPVNYYALGVATKGVPIFDGGNKHPALHVVGIAIDLGSQLIPKS